MKQLKVGWRQQHVARAKGVPDAHEPFRETFGMSEDEDESEDEDAESVAESVDLDDPNYRAPWDLRPIAPPPRAGSISRLGHSYEESLVPMDIHEALGETPKPPSILVPPNHPGNELRSGRSSSCRGNHLFCHIATN